MLFKFQCQIPAEWRDDNNERTRRQIAGHMADDLAKIIQITESETRLPYARQPVKRLHAEVHIFAPSHVEHIIGMLKVARFSTFTGTNIIDEIIKEFDK